MDRIRSASVRVVTIESTKITVSPGAAILATL
jgi:hypothetical protein